MSLPQPRQTTETVNEETPMKAITPKGRLSYPHLFEPQTPPNSNEPVYSCALVFDEGTDLGELKKIAQAVAQEKWGAKYAELMKAGKIRSPFRDDGEEKGYPPGSVFINVKSKQAPGVVSIYPGPDGKPQKITDPAEIYAGCYARVSVRAFAYDTQGNRGVSFALNNVQKLADGDRLDGRSRAEDEFEADSSAAADLDDF
jgi:hypothetical protein